MFKEGNRKGGKGNRNIFVCKQLGLNWAKQLHSNCLLPWTRFAVTKHTGPSISTQNFTDKLLLVVVTVTASVV
jgi:hypothetical protein